MTNTNTNFKTFMLNLCNFLTFGFSLIWKGTCDERIKGEYVLYQDYENKGYIKTEASKILNL